MSLLDKVASQSVCFKEGFSAIWIWPFSHETSCWSGVGMPKQAKQHDTDTIDLNPRSSSSEKSAGLSFRSHNLIQSTARPISGHAYAIQSSLPKFRNKSVRVRDHDHGERKPEFGLNAD
ncbi:uncharacterized protein MEPE_03263 [Melanopsichium pennsylvanicum]|uniref:Uncharacterized protein n=1 Tax=Melanopsichium pennsylvanicum TaxID=63383 RepID=A0AAJ5C5I0_9BASI|nr:uncharacterized protein MEPE_03263 [Melanopsichium pennsylvanicum]